MREILFRGKRKDNGEWVYGGYARLSNHACFSHNLKYTHFIMKDESIDIGIGALVDYEVIPETVGQFTGLTDKNGTKIFEGDICRNTKTGEVVSVKWHGTFAGFVWSRRRNDNGNLFDFGELFRAHDKYEVIGNIHDNEELLKGGELDES